MLAADLTLLHSPSAQALCRIQDTQGAPVSRAAELSRAEPVMRLKSVGSSTSDAVMRMDGG